MGTMWFGAKAIGFLLDLLSSSTAIIIALVSPGSHRKRGRVGVAPLALAGLAACWAAGVPVLGTERSPTDFFFQTWQTEHGLPQNHSTAIVQTRDGYLWIGTYNGLARFDGVRFAVFNTTNTRGLRSSRVTSLYEDHSGTLWLGHDTGELTRMSGGRFEPVPLATNWPGGTVFAIGQDATHNLWLLRESGLLFCVQTKQCLRTRDRLRRHWFTMPWGIFGGSMPEECGWWAVRQGHRPARRPLRMISLSARVPAGEAVCGWPAVKGCAAGAPVAR